MDDKTAIMHLRLAIVGGCIIVAVGFLSMLRYHHVPVLSFVVGPLISYTAWRGLREVTRKRGFSQIRLRSTSGRRRR